MGGFFTTAPPGNCTRLGPVILACQHWGEGEDRAIFALFGEQEAALLHKLGGPSSSTSQQTVLWAGTGAKAGEKLGVYSIPTLSSEAWSCAPTTQRIGILGPARLQASVSVIGRCSFQIPSNWPSGSSPGSLEITPVVSMALLPRTSLSGQRGSWHSGELSLISAVAFSLLRPMGFTIGLLSPEFGVLQPRLL